MPKIFDPIFLYATEGIHGLAGDSASGRPGPMSRQPSEPSGKGGGVLLRISAPTIRSSFLDLPDNVTAAAVALTRLEPERFGSAPHLC